MKKVWEEPFPEKLLPFRIIRSQNRHIRPVVLFLHPLIGGFHCACAPRSALLHLKALHVRDLFEQRAVALMAGEDEKLTFPVGGEL